jgi:hypothetical protein
MNYDERFFEGLKQMTPEDMEKVNFPIIDVSDIINKEHSVEKKKVTTVLFREHLSYYGSNLPIEEIDITHFKFGGYINGEFQSFALQTMYKVKLLIFIDDNGDTKTLKDKFSRERMPYIKYNNE